MVNLEMQELLNDKSSRKFQNMFQDSKFNIPLLLEFFSNDERQERMVTAQTALNKCALAGVILELENTLEFQELLSNPRGRQFIGMIVRKIMESKGFVPTGTQGALGGWRRIVPDGVLTKNLQPTPTKVRSGISKFFSRSEHYARKESVQM